MKTPSPEQQQAIQAILARLAQGRDASLSGPAGSGKTTCISTILASLPPSTTALLAPTGRAAKVLRSKGLNTAQTIHSFAYRVTTTTNVETIRLPSGNIEQVGTPIFAERAPTNHHTHFIIDEASMIGMSTRNHLESLGGVRVYVGDTYQLLPVMQRNGNCLSRPTASLTTVHRHGSKILDFVTAIRLGEDTLRGDLKHSNTGIKRHPKSYKEIADMFVANSMDAIIVATNKQRQALNARIRQRMGFTKPLHVGDRLICLKNDHAFGFANGDIYEVVEIPTSKVIILKSTDDPTAPLVRSSISMEQLTNNEVFLNSMTRQFHYAYAITAHKAQGSQFDTIGVLAEPSDTMFQCNLNWAYTAASRAINRLCVFT